MDVEHQQRLFRSAVEAGNMRAEWNWPGGWSIHVVIRRGGEAWGEDPVITYDGLSTPELLDVVCSVWASLLDL